VTNIFSRILTCRI